MSIYKRGAMWWMMFTYKGNRFQRSTGLKNKREAQEFERAFRTKLVKGEIGLESNKEIPIFSQAVKEFLAWSKNEHKEKTNTVQGYANSCKNLLSFF